MTLKLLLGLLLILQLQMIGFEFDKTTTGIGQITMGSTSVPQVLNINPEQMLLVKQLTFYILLELVIALIYTANILKSL